MQNIILNNTAGDATNSKSDGKAAGHNTDGFGYASSDNIILRDSKVYNQDDCVVITSGNNISVSNMYCYGGHGLSIGSVGGKSSNGLRISPDREQSANITIDNTVTNVVFKDSIVAAQENALRIKSNSDTTGLISG